MVDETAGERLGKVKISPIGTDAKIDVVPVWRDVAVDVCLCIRTIVGNSVDVYLFFCLVPVHLSVQGTHATAFKLKLLNLESCIGLQVSENTADVSITSSQSAEFYGVEVDEVEDVAYLDVLQSHN